MNIFRIYNSQVLNLHKTIILCDQSMHHLKNVLRIKIGNSIIIFNNENQEFLGKITKFNNKNIYVFLIKKIYNNTESSLRIHLGQVICSRKSMEYVIQKSVELGVNKITPLYSSHCYVNMNNYKIKKKIKRWETIIIHATQQCGRKFLLKINYPISILEWLNEKNNALNIYSDPQSKNKIKDINGNYNHVRLLIGPEGGLSKQEYENLIKNNFYKIKIGPRTLRVETSVLSAITLLQTYFGDF